MTSTIRKYEGKVIHLPAKPEIGSRIVANYDTIGTVEAVARGGDDIEVKVGGKITYFHKNSLTKLYIRIEGEEDVPLWGMDYREGLKRVGSFVFFTSPTEGGLKVAKLA